MGHRQCSGRPRGAQLGDQFLPFPGNKFGPSRHYKAEIDRSSIAATVLEPRKKRKAVMKFAFAAVVALGSFVFVEAAQAQSKKGAPTAAAKGTFTFDDKTYKVASALAYTVTVDDKKKTVVILADKPL